MNLRLTSLLVAMVVSIPSFAVYKIGDTVGNLCWKNQLDKNVCLNDSAGDVRILLYNAGWCPPCNTEFKELVPQIGEFKNKNVTFISISAEGWSRGAIPNATFLKEWQSKHNIPFEVTGNRRDFGKDFFNPPNYIPNVVIIDENNKLTYAKVNPGADAIMDEVRNMVP
jgi:thiol-disulfide isomerase/thioredoxin